MAKTLAKKPAKSPARPIVKRSAKRPTKPLSKTKPVKVVKKSAAPPIAVKPSKTKTPATKVGTQGKLTPDRAAIAGKNPLPKGGKATPPAAGAVSVNGRAGVSTGRPAAGGRTATASPAPVSKPSATKSPVMNSLLTKSSSFKPLPVIIPSPVPTDGKPRKNQAGLSSRELESYRELLLARRRELVGDMSSMEREALRSANSNPSNQPVHLEDQGTDNYEQEFTLGLVEKDRNLLREINRALGKIQDGTYGICEGTAKPIGKPRLEAQPWAKYSIEYARELEKGGVRR